MALTPAEQAPAPTPRPARRARPYLMAAAVYVALGVVLDPAWFHGAAHVAEMGGQGDVGEEIWFLGLPVYQLLHGHNPLLTNVIAYPGGVNMMANTNMVVPALLLAPVTLLSGPITSFNVLLSGGLAASALAAFALCRRLGASGPAAFVGGLLYGFSPALLLQGRGHLFLVFAPIPPLLVLAVDRLLVRPRGRPWAWGAALGALLVAQLLTSEELLAIVSVVGVVGLVVLAAAAPGLALARVREAAGGLVCAAAVGVAGAVYPLWLQLFGPDRVSGPAQPLAVLDRPMDLAGFVVPSGGHVGSSLVSDALGAVVGHGESGLYLGVPLLVVLVAVAVWCRRSRVVQVSALLTAVAGVLALGPRLQVDGHVSAVRLPFDVLTGLPLLDSLIPVRFGIVMFLFAGALLAMGLDRSAAAVRAWASGGRRPRWAGLGAAAVVAVVALAPLVRTAGYATAPVPVPAFFTGAVGSDVPGGATLLTYPFPRGPQHDEAMIWQAEAGMRFRMPGGYVITPTPSGGATFSGDPTSTEATLQACYDGSPGGAGGDDEGGAVREEVGADLERWQVSTIVVWAGAPHAACAVSLFEAVVGRAPTPVGGVDLWSVRWWTFRGAT